MGVSFIRFMACAALALMIRPAWAEHASFLDTNALPYFQADYLVCDSAPAPAELVVTLAGDCTLGGTESASRNRNGLVMTVERNGLDYPFSGLLPLFSKDDVTLVNLEGVLSDSSRGENTDKEFAFRGPASFAGILAKGSVEAVNISNNHFDDYGKTGREATLKALVEHGIGYAGGEWLCIFSTDRGKIGLAGIRGSLTEDKKRIIDRQMALLKEAGCQVVVYSLHAGQEYAPMHNGLQRDMARYLIDAGADVVAGHHPHVPQGVEIYKNRLIFYSLGNCVFGGNHDPRESDALVASITFRLEDGRLKSLQAVLHPIRFTGKSGDNTFSPVLLSGKQAEAALKKVQKDTPFALPGYTPGIGVLLPPLPVE